MSISFAPEKNERRVNIKVVGVGGAGGNAVNRMIEAGLSEVDFFAVNTDGQALDTSRAHQTLVIGSELTRGLGAGGDPRVGHAAAEEDRELLASMVEGADMVFVTAGMGGGTGTGAAPVVAEVARKAGALTVAVVTRPFFFEGFRRAQQADSGLEALREHVDALLVIPNERLMDIELPDGGMTEVFRVADNVLYEATRGISDIIAQQAVVNLDFADVRTVMKDSGAALMGTGRATGSGRAEQAAEQAIRSPLLENVDISGSRAVLVYLTAANVDREDLRGAMGHIQQAVGADAHIFFGFANDASLEDELRVTVIATGFPAASGEPAATVSVAVEPAVAPAVVETPEVAESPAVVETPAIEVEPVDAPEPAPVVAEAPEIAAVAKPTIELVPEPTPEPTPEPAPTFEQAPEPRDEAVAAPQAIRPPAIEMVPEEPTDDASTAVEPTVATPEPREAASEVARRQESSRALEALAEAAGGVSRTNETPEATEPSDTSRRFLRPMGEVKLQDPGGTGESAAPTQRFRSTVLGDDKVRPAWERKYVD